MLQLKNNTPFKAAFALYPDINGIDTLYVMAKATFVIGPQWTLAQEQIPIFEADEYCDEPGLSSLKNIGEYHIGKPSTDILMYGLACSLEQRPVRQMDVGLRVGNLQKHIRVFGDRCWNHQQISQPNPFVNMPLVYERAYGGQDIDRQIVRATELRNPVGKGFLGEKTAADIEGLALPNIEAPSQLIGHWRDCPTPIAFGPIAPHWSPRVNMGGTYDQQWQEQRAPYLPDDFNPRFLNAAPVDQIYPAFMQGGEPVHIIGMHPAGEFKFNVPYVNVVNKIKLKGEVVSSPFKMETLALYPNQQQITMTWRAALNCDKKMLAIEEIALNLMR
ncbi:MAG: DUF2169 domain-containing protein [Marinagarivorans sp.]|nr:DUF2169 domain-containing protein [Marinagarivorans sp.]